MSRYVLGIDGGGSKTDAALMDESGRIVGWGSAGPTHGGFERDAVVEEAVPSALRDALAGASADVSAVVTCCCHRRAVEAVRDACPSAAVRHVGELDVVFAAHRLDAGLVVLASTGSGAQARNRDGRVVHLGGFGPVISDEGSAHDIAVRALRACIHSGWFRERRTTLRERMLRETGCEHAYELIGYYHYRETTRSEVAALAPAVDAEAEAGDRIARRIIEDAARDLGDLALCALTEAGMVGEPYPLIPAGSVAKRSRIFWDTVVRHVRRGSPALVPHPPGMSAAVGGALLALRDIGVAWTDQVFARAQESAAGFDGPS